MRGLKKEEIDGREEAVVAEMRTDPGAWMKIFSL